MKHALKCPLVIVVRAVSHWFLVLFLFFFLITITLYNQKSHIPSLAFVFDFWFCISNFKVSYMDRDVRIQQFLKICQVKCHHLKLPISFTMSSEDLLSINLKFHWFLLAYAKYWSNGYLASQSH